MRVSLRLRVRSATVLSIFGIWCSQLSVCIWLTLALHVSLTLVGLLVDQVGHRRKIPALLSMNLGGRGHQIVAVASAGVVLSQWLREEPHHCSRIGRRCADAVALTVVVLLLQLIDSRCFL